MKWLVLLLALTTTVVRAAPATTGGQGPGQRLAEINTQIEALSGKINFAAANRESVERAIRRFHEDNQAAFARQAKRGLDQEGWGRIQTSVTQSGTRLNKALDGLVPPEQQPLVSELVTLMRQSFLLRMRIQAFQQRRRDDNN
ncbi:MAG: hypothetical protein ACFHX7_05195 [Pseudomonadota bacterium]